MEFYIQCKTNASYLYNGWLDFFISHQNSHETQWNMKHEKLWKVCDQKQKHFQTSRLLKKDDVKLLEVEQGSQKANLLAIEVRRHNR